MLKEAVSSALSKGGKGKHTDLRGVVEKTGLSYNVVDYVKHKILVNEEEAGREGAEKREEEYAKERNRQKAASYHRHKESISKRRRLIRNRKKAGTYIRRPAAPAQCEICKISFVKKGWERWKNHCLTLGHLQNAKKAEKG